MDKNEFFRLLVTYSKFFHVLKVLLLEFIKLIILKKYYLLGISKELKSVFLSYSLVLLVSIFQIFREYF